MLVLEYSLWLIVVAVAIAVILSRSLLRTLVYLAIFSLCSACLYLLMHAPDVAITEAAIGAAISAIFILAAIRSVGKKEEEQRRNVAFGGVIVTALTLVTFLAIADLPAFGEANSPAYKGSSHEYLASAYEDIGVPNVVTAVLGSYRSFDTLGEVYVVLAAVLSVMLVLPIRKSLNQRRDAK